MGKSCINGTDGRAYLGFTLENLKHDLNNLGGTKVRLLMWFSEKKFSTLRGEVVADRAKPHSTSRYF